MYYTKVYLGTCIHIRPTNLYSNSMQIQDSKISTNNSNLNGFSYYIKFFIEVFLNKKHMYASVEVCVFFVYVNRLCFSDFPMRSFVVSSLLRIREETFKGRRRPFSFSAVRLSAWTSLQSYSMVSHLNSCDISYRM